MSKLKFYKLIAIALLALNIIILGFFLMKKKGRRPEPKKIIIERLAFNDNQIEEYDKLIEVHREQINSLRNRIQANKNKLYAALNHETQNTSATDSLMTEINNSKAEIEKVHYAHFLDIKQICTAEQLPKFELLSKDLSKFFSPKGPKHKSKP